MKSESMLATEKMLDVVKTLLDEEQPEAVVICERCGNQIAPVRKRDGSTWHVESMAKFSKGKFGTALCGECMKQVQKEQGT